MDDRVVLYDMKEDPTIAQLIANNSIKGLWIGNRRRPRRGRDSLSSRRYLYRADLDLKIKGSQLILINRHQRKFFTREKLNSERRVRGKRSYSSGCSPPKAGWLRGPSFGRHVPLRRGDEMGERLLAGSAYPEYKIAMERCSGATNDCGPIGCPELGAIAISSATSIRLSTAAATLSQVLLDTKLSAPEILKNYKSDINTICCKS